MPSESFKSFLIYSLQQFCELLPLSSICMERSSSRKWLSVLHKLAYFISAWEEIGIHCLLTPSPKFLITIQYITSPPYLAFLPTRSHDILLRSKIKWHFLALPCQCYQFPYSVLAPGNLDLSLWFWSTCLMNSREYHDNENQNLLTCHSQTVHEPLTKHVPFCLRGRDAILQPKASSLVPNFIQSYSSFSKSSPFSYILNLPFSNTFILSP